MFGAKPVAFLAGSSEDFALGLPAREPLLSYLNGEGRIGAAIVNAPGREAAGAVEALVEDKR